MFRLTAICAATALLLTACASDTTNPNTAGTGSNGTGGISNAGLRGPGGRGAPGSQEDLTQSAGDRIYFDTDQSQVTSDASAILDRQAQWL
jgi:peptidoglycan-associated lipoprotein